MLAWEIARQWYQDHNITASFEERLGWHLSRGLVYSTPLAFMLAEEVTWDEEQSTISNQQSTTPNAWYCELAVLDGMPLWELFRVFPHCREWLLFRRNNGFKIHAYRWDRFARKVGYQPLSPIT